MTLNGGVDAQEGYPFVNYRFGPESVNILISTGCSALPSVLLPAAPKMSAHIGMERRFTRTSGVLTFA